MKTVDYNQFNQIIAFANQQFSGDYQVDFIKIQPKIYHHPERFAHHHYIYEEQNQIVGLIGTYPLEYQGLKLLGIGTVCVNRNYRNQGIMQKMFAYLDDVQKQYDIIYLSGDKTRYEHFGFYKTGKYVKYRLKFNAFKSKNYDVMNIQSYLHESQDVNQNLYQLYLDNSKGISRNADIFYDVLKTNQAEVYLLANLQGYLVYHPKRKLIAELVIDSSKLETAIYNFMKYKNLQEVYYELSIDDERVNSIYQISEENYLVTMMNFKIINYINVIKSVLRKKKRIKRGKLVIEIDSKVKLMIEVNSCVNVQEVFDEKVDLSLSSKEMHSLLLDDFTFFYPHFDKKVDLIKSWFPLYLPVTLHSIDSI